MRVTDLASLPFADVLAALRQSITTILNDDRIRQTNPTYPFYPAVTDTEDDDEDDDASVHAVDRCDHGECGHTEVTSFAARSIEERLAILSSVKSALPTENRHLIDRLIQMDTGMHRLLSR